MTTFKRVRFKKVESNESETNINTLLKKEFKSGIVIGFLCFVAITLLLFTLSNNYKTKSYLNEVSIPNISFPQVTYINISQSNQSYFEDVLFSMNSLYFYEQRDVIVLSDISPYCNDCDAQNIESENKIVFKFKRDEFYIKEVLCHEFMHTYIKREVGDEDALHPLHQIVYDLGIKHVCFD